MIRRGESLCPVQYDDIARYRAPLRARVLDEPRKEEEKEMTTTQYVPTRTGMTVDAFKRALLDNLYYILGKDASSATPADFYMALAYTVRDRMIHRWLATIRTFECSHARTVYYLSAEYLLGRQLGNNLLNEDLTEIAREALAQLGLNLEALCELEPEPGLGNGGLGRLAACFLDSLASLNYPAVGYGIRYEYGIFRQTFVEGWQVEQPDHWLACTYPWEFPHYDMRVEVGFGGYTEPWTDERGHYRVRWKPARTVFGVPYNIMVPGYGTDNVNTLRLWSAQAVESFDLRLFNAGDYIRAIEGRVLSENITRVLYPDDTTPQGRQLRLEQQYFFVACSLRDILSTFRSQESDWERLPERVVIQLNDTHPAIAIAEMMRLLLDDEGLTWEQAWGITSRCFGYTVHTLLPEALEEWPVELFERLLPRHLEIVYEINARFLAEVAQRYHGNIERLARMSIIREHPERRVRMAHLACVGAYAINGVAALHSRLLREHTLRDFAEYWPEKFSNKTNGVTPRRFLKLSNPRLADLIASRIGDAWLNDLDQLRQLEPLADDPAFRAAWREVKQQNKQALAADIQQSLGLAVDPTSLFDVMVKRLHEYKRQLLKALHMITLYRRILENPSLDIAPRTFIFGAKAAPGYWMAKLIIRLINGVAEVVNADPVVCGRLKVAFLPNFNVSMAERIYPAADLSEQISLAGKEASGTGNMKFALNGAVTIGTLDGANIEIRERVGEENFFLFGMTADEVFALRNAGYRPREIYDRSPALRGVIDMIAGGRFSRGDREMLRPLVDYLINRDPFMHLADYESYCTVQEAVDAAYRDQERWTRMSILNTARCGYFSSDRTIREYCDEIWKIHPVRVQLPG
jgi:starch phosphorylase